MKRILMIALILLGAGLSTHNISAAKLTICNGTIYNTKPCAYRVCMTYLDCLGNTVTNCAIVPAGGAVPMNSINGGCCNAILSFTIQYFSGGPISPSVTPGNFGAYSAPPAVVPPPCNSAILDYTSLPDFRIN